MAQVMGMLDEVRRSYDLSILITTHDFSMLERYVDTVVLLKETVIKTGTPQEVLHSPEFREIFRLGGAS